MPYDLTFNRNLINKRKKQKGKGGRVFRNMYEGHNDKTKGGRIKGGKW